MMNLININRTSLREALAFALARRREHAIDIQIAKDGSDPILVRIRGNEKLVSVIQVGGYAQVYGSDGEVVDVVAALLEATHGSDWMMTEYVPEPTQPLSAIIPERLQIFVAALPYCLKRAEGLEPKEDDRRARAIDEALRYADEALVKLRG